MEAPEEKRTTIWRLAGIRWKLSRNLLQIRLSVRYTDKRIEREPRGKVVHAAPLWKRSRRSVERRFAIVTSQTRLPEQL